MESPIGGEPDELDDTFDGTENDTHEDVNAEAYLDKMTRLLREDGVKFPNDNKQAFATLDPFDGGILHAEGSWENGDSDRRVAGCVRSTTRTCGLRCRLSSVFVQHFEMRLMTLFLQVSVLMVQHKRQFKTI